MIESHWSANPFFTSNYIAAKQRLGFSTWVAGLQEQRNIRVAIPLFLKAGRLSSWMEITSVEPGTEAVEFWQGLYEFCRKHGVTDLSVGTFASQPVEVPKLRGEIHRECGNEYVLELSGLKIPGAFGNNHRRNIKKAEQSGVQIRRVTDPASREEHVSLMRASLAGGGIAAKKCRRHWTQGPVVSWWRVVPDSYTRQFMKAWSYRRFLC